MSTTLQSPPPDRQLIGLPIFTPAAAKALGYESITTPINANTEENILKSVAHGRNPQRTVWIMVGTTTYELAIKREDILRTPEN